MPKKTTIPKDRANDAWFQAVEALAAAIVGLVGAKEDTERFIDDEDLMEPADGLAVAMQGDAPSLDERIAVGEMIRSKLTREEWSRWDKIVSADNYLAICRIEAGILIGVELERARNRGLMAKERLSA